MKKYFAFFTVLLSLCINAQFSKTEIDNELLQIFREYRDSEIVIHNKILKKYEEMHFYKNDSLKKEESKAYDSYYDALIPHRKIATQKMKALAEKIGNSLPLISKENLPKKDLVESNSDYITNQILELRKSYNENSNVYYFDETNIGGTLSTTVSLKIDSDGIIKDIKAEGDKEDFNYLTIITLYSLAKKISINPNEIHDFPLRYKMKLTFEFGNL